MATLADLNTYSSNSVDYTAQDQDISVTAGVSFSVPVITWDLARSIGNTTGNGALITITHPDCTLTFPNINQAVSNLTVSNISANVTSISGMQSFVDWSAAYIVANCTADTTTLTTVFSDVGDTGNLTITINGL